MSTQLFRTANISLTWLLCPAFLYIAHPSVALAEVGKPSTFNLKAKDTLTVVQMNHGDVLRFRLKNGEVRTFELEATTARIVERVPGGIIYAFECRLRADGQPMTLRRFVCSQETFYEPWVVNGVRIWFSSSRSIFKLVPIRYPEVHDKLDSDAILAVQDATLPICPQPMRLWFPIKRHFIDVGTCYNGDDPWMGPYLGRACHMGLDINMRKGTPLYAPIDFDDQWIFSANHRWRGVRRWDNGDIWALQSHHVDRLLVKERKPVKAGTHYAEGAGKGVGSHQHSHFEFRLGPATLKAGRLGGIEVDPWILFWQIFETDKEAKEMIRAAIDPLTPTSAGRPVRFKASGSRAGKGARPLHYYWTFGDGGWSNEPAPEYTFARAGVYPVTLVVDDGKQRATHTQHITVNGTAVQSPALVLHARDEVSFRPRPVPAADVYGWPVKHIPHTLRFTTVPNGPATQAQEILLRNISSGELPQAETPDVTYLSGKDWLRFKQQGEGNRQRIQASVDPRDLPAGCYEAIVTVCCPKVLNGKQAFRVELKVRPTPKSQQIIVDDKDDGFYATPFFWVGHQFLRSPHRGYRKRYLTNGRQSDSNAIVRYTPDLAAGRYEVLFHPQTPLLEAAFPVRIRHAAGEKTVRFKRSKSAPRSLGVFEFNEGTHGFVEIQAKDATGLVVVDALVFRRVKER